MGFFELMRDLLKGKEGIIKKYRLKCGFKPGKNFECYSWEGIDANWPWLISVGDNVTIAGGVTILAHDASPAKFVGKTKIGRVHIGNNVFIGARSVILCDTKIGDNVIVGAASVVSRDLPSGFVYAGNPARPIGTIEEFTEKHKKAQGERIDFSKKKPWYVWKKANDAEKKAMADALSEKWGYI